MSRITVACCLGVLGLIPGRTMISVERLLALCYPVNWAQCVHAPQGLGSVRPFKKALKKT
jgi:hypothetical protein